MASEDPPRNHPARSDRPRGHSKGGKPFGNKPHGGKPRGDKPYGGKPRGDKPYGAKPRGDRPYGDRPRGDKPYGDKPRGDRPYGDRPRGDKPYGDKPRGDRPYGDRPRGDRPYGDKPRGDRPYGGKPYGGGSQGGKPYRGKPWRERAAPEPSQHEGERIAKVMARAGVCSRRDAEDWIGAGRVTVNGEVITSPALNIGPRDRVSVDGAPLPERERTRLFLYHKPQGLVTTNADPEGRPTIFENLPKNLPRLVTIGRLDIGTEGLLLLTNDGGLARVLELPDTAWLRRYRVRAMGSVTQPDLDALRDGITVEGIQYGPIEATLDREQGSNVWITFAIREGKNREVRNVLGHLGLAVNRLIRVSYGPFQLGELAEGEVEEVRTRVLRDQLGERVIDEAECDFSAHIVQRPETATLAPPPDRDRRGGRERREDDRPRRDDRPRDDYGDKRIRRDHRGDATPEDQGRPRRGHSWRADDAPVRRHYRGERKEKFVPDATAEKRAGLLEDRKGRQVLVERIGSAKPEPRDDRPKRPHGKRPDRPHGKRFDRPGGERFERPREDRPFKRDDRPGGRRFDKPRGERFDQPKGDRPFKRDDRPGGKRFDKPRGERFDRPEGDRPFRRDDRPGKPGGKRFDKPQGGRPYKGRPGKPDRGGGPRPSGRR
jgi:23S rRNA pseudouridine2605 synthase